jgi:hypothetical protein
MKKMMIVCLLFSFVHLNGNSCSDVLDALENDLYNGYLSPIEKSTFENYDMSDQSMDLYKIELASCLKARYEENTSSYQIVCEKDEEELVEYFREKEEREYQSLVSAIEEADAAFHEFCCKLSEALAVESGTGSYRSYVRSSTTQELVEWYTEYMRKKLILKN